MATVRRTDGQIDQVPSSQLQLGDLCVVSAGEVIPGDGDVVEGIATVDESAITGESAPVIRESGGDRSAVTGGTRVLSDQIVVRITARPGETFLDRMIALVEGADRQKTPNEIALSILLAGLTIIFLLAVVTLQPFAIYSGAEQQIIVLVALLVCLIPTTIGGLLSAIGIAGMDRLVQRNVLAMSGRVVEAAGDVTTLLLDKTGTITFGARQASELIPVHGVTDEELAEAALASSLADETPEGRSIVEYALREYHLVEPRVPDATMVPFTAQTRMSGMDFPSADGRPGRQVRKGAAETVERMVEAEGGTVPLELLPTVEQISRDGATPLVVCDRVDGDVPRILGVIRLKDTVKPGMRERFDQLRAMGIRTVMITGDNRLTAQAIAAEAGVDDFLAEATPEDKMALIRREQEGGNLVAMTGDGTNDAPSPRPGRRRCGDEQRHASGERSGEHGRPRLEPDEADRSRRDRQTALDHAWLAHDVFDRQRRGEVLRHHPRHVRRRASRARPHQRDGSRHAALGDPVGGDLQRLDHRGLDPPRLARREVPCRVGRCSASPQPADLRRRWHHRPVCRDQAHRHPHHRVGSLLMNALLRQLRPAVLAVVAFTVICGLAYPLAVTAIAQVGWGDKADGSLIERNGTVVGSELIGQTFVSPEYFHSRPSAAGDGYDGAASSGSNLGPTNAEYLATVAERVAAYREENGLGPDTLVPVDAVTASGSGLDPHISVRNARLQAPRVAAERGVDVEAVSKLIDENTADRTLGFLGDPGVNVVTLNLDLDENMGS